jgi:type II secretion system protein N
MKLPRIDVARLRELASARGIALHLSGRQRKIARWAGMGLLAMASFLVALRFTFPYERLKGKLADVLHDKYDVKVGDVGPGFLPGTVVFEDVVLRSHPATPEEKPTEIMVDRLVLDLGLDFGLVGVLRKKAVFDIHADLVGGEIDADIDSSASYVEAHIETEGLALGKLPGVAAAVGLPMAGSLDAEVDLRLPAGKWKNAEGNIAISCVGCAVGDGHAKMTMNSGASSSSSRRRRTSAGAAAFSSTGVTVPRLDLGDARIQVDINKGVGEIKTFAATSKDGWLKIEGKIEFRDPFANSLFPGCMRFKLSDELKKRDPNFGNVEYTLSEKTRQADGSFAIPTKGRLTELRWDVRRKCGGGSADEDVEHTPPERPGLAGRPSLGVQPPEGGTQVEPGQVPGVSGAVLGQDPNHGMDVSGQQPEVPAPGASGPPIGAAAGQPAPPAGTVPPQGSFDAGASPPPPPQQDYAPEGTATVRRMRPEDPPPPPNEPQVLQPAEPNPPPDQGEYRPPEGDQQQQPPPPQQGQEQPAPEAQAPADPRYPEDRPTR